MTPADLRRLWPAEEPDSLMSLLTALWEAADVWEDARGPTEATEATAVLLGALDRLAAYEGGMLR